MRDAVLRMSYSLHNYGWMMADAVRTAAYDRALRQTIRGGEVVVDLGAGLGLLTVLACRHGAGHVYAIEASELIEIARLVVADNGVADRVTLIHDLSTNVSLPRRADVLVADVHGRLPFYQQSLGSVLDARRRLLEQGARLVPQADTVWAAPVSAAELYQDHIGLWDGKPEGVEVGAGRRFAANMVIAPKKEPRQMLGEPRVLCRIDYRTFEETAVHAEASTVIRQAGVLHGMLAWFDCTLAEGVTLSNAPDQPPTVYRSLMFPVEKPAEVQAGDRCDVALHAIPMQDGYTFSWRIRVVSAGGEKREHNQSELFSGPLRQMRKQSPEYAPAPGRDGEITRACLELMSGERSNAEIAQELRARFPGMSEEEAQRRAVRAAVEFGR